MAKHILIVDDEQDIRVIVRISLEKFAGWRTILAATAEEALEKARSQLPDAILLDITMPDTDGFQVWDKLQSDPLTKSIPVILLTAKTSSLDKKRFSDMGVAGVITKPFNPIIIWKQVQEILAWDS
ncbi:response regulator [Cylindrospermopsis raciborskii CENA303]|uniref:Response regulator n=1 Tax=Cylindrospermopsis raciborskii CENA303 TaxID=1170769 RepID=A0A1X4GJE7_9CYAN|nr:response regulator [Cylindrospermopsis raciborskii]EFA72357.1 Response regulator receiver domain protein (CheY) [Raphidiopsis brookii D9]OSO97248.1 response regulator [Cylindrospermopsis raciborskii CENA303]